MAAKSDCSCKTAGEGFTILAHYQNNYLIEISGLYTRDTLKLHLYPSISQTKSSPGQFISQPKSHCTMHARTKIATSRTYRYTKPIKFRLITNHTVFSVTNHIAAPIHIFPKHLMAIGHVSTRNQISPSEVHPASTITPQIQAANNPDLQQFGTEKRIMFRFQYEAQLKTPQKQNFRSPTATTITIINVAPNSALPPLFTASSKPALDPILIIRAAHSSKPIASANSSPSLTVIALPNHRASSFRKIPSCIHSSPPSPVFADL